MTIQTLDLRGKNISRIVKNTANTIGRNHNKNFCAKVAIFGNEAYADLWKMTGNEWYNTLALIDNAQAAQLRDAIALHEELSKAYNRS